MLPADGGVRVQVVVGAPDDAGRRTVDIYSRPAGDDTDAGWTRHADGALAPVGAGSEPGSDLAVWPPAGR